MTPVSLLASVDRDERQALFPVVIRQRLRQRIQVAHAVVVDADAGHLLGGKASAIQKTGVVGRRNIKPRHAKRRTPHPPVGGEQRRGSFRRAGGEHHMIRLAVDEHGHVAPRFLDDAARGTAFAMHR